MKVKAIKKNVTEIVSNDGHTMVLVSYETPVAFHRSGELPYVTEEKHSLTTTRHVKEWLARHDFEKYEWVSQESVDLMAENFGGAATNPPKQTRRIVG